MNRVVFKIWFEGTPKHFMRPLFLANRTK